MKSVFDCRYINPYPFQIDVILLLYNIEPIRKTRTIHKTFSFIVLSFKQLKYEIKRENFSQIYWFLARLYEAQGELLQSPRSSASAPVSAPRSRHTATKFYIQVFQKFISRQPLIRKHSYLDHSYPGGPALIPYILTPGLMPRGGARGQKLGHL